MSLRQPILAVALVAVCMGLLYTLYWAQESYSQTIPIYFAVGNAVGYAADTEALYFGSVAPGESAQRTVVLQNYKEHAFKAQFKLEGEGATWIALPKEVLVESSHFPVVAILKVPKDAPEKAYSGLLSIYYEKVS